MRIFAEIVDAPNMSLEAILEQAHAYRNAGADVIDLGCLPETPFRHLEEAVAALHAAGLHRQRGFDGCRRNCCAAAAPALTSC